LKSKTLCDKIIEKSVINADCVETVATEEPAASMAWTTKQEDKPVRSRQRASEIWVLLDMSGLSVLSDYKIFHS
jgi:hypothetical protein